ncbi:putative fluoride ion transporter CrcB [Chitinimonas prasina]|uniref:Fluoride-specific ion channel FluC n=1 Tax=Chitinimonas prasina TaxID=1434937 RepID=A0ABQ5YAL7_9NEIS|nr:fluoride efflux transporter CrcB [Chitinimonas prasina]GLR11987.1 putative fluoride ion transporter CrcB [Chitinimonas prasina]
MLLPVLAVSLGAALGALARWGLTNWLSTLSSNLSVGTLASNLVGGYLVGIAVSYFAQHPGLAPEWRLFVITGFLGGLTTFSSYSAEVVDMMLRGQFGWALSTAASHLFGSFFMTAFGIYTVLFFYRR